MIHINSPATYGFLWEFTVRYIRHTHHIKYKKNTTISTILLQKWRETQSYTTCSVYMVANSYTVSTSADVFTKITAVTFKIYQIINFHSSSIETKNKTGNLIRYAKLNKISNKVFSGDQPYQRGVSVQCFKYVSIITPDKGERPSLWNIEC